MTTLSVPSINLMPAARVASGARRRRMHAWAGALTICAVVCGAAWAYFTFMNGRVGSVAEELAKAQARRQELKREVSAVSAKVAHARREAEARHEVQFHPDWGVLLRSIAAACEDSATLEKVELTPVQVTDAKAPKSDLAAPLGYKLKLTGLAATQGDVPRLARELEKLGLFDSVAVQSIRAREAPVILREDGTKVPQPQLFWFEVEGVMSDSAAARAVGAHGGGQ